MILSDFRWATGIECSFIPHLNIDQYRWTQHDRFWRADFERIARDLGCRWLRYALPWHQIEPHPGHYEWQWFDERLQLAESLGIRFLLDLVHFGTPTWLPDAFADVDFPLALERFARAFGERYARRVPCVCPINEPLITALFCGDIGLWPPYGRGLESYMTVLGRVAQGWCRATRGLRETMPGVEILLCDSLETAVTYEDSDETTSPFLKESLRADVERRMRRRHVVTDLVLGRVDRRHPLLPWLQRHGFSNYDLNWFQRNAQSIDILGLDYYEHTEVELYTTPEGYYRQRALKPPVGLYRAAQDYWLKYRIPLMVTETSVGGGDQEKLAWLERSVADVRRLRAEGFPVIGYTWWPAIDHLDWDGALLHQTGHIHPVGIYRLERRPDGSLARAPTALRDRYISFLADGDESAGPLIETAEQREHREAGASTPAVSSSRLGWPVVVHGRTLWDGLPGRAQHVFSALSRHHRILYVEPPHTREDEPCPRSGLGFYPLLPNLCVLSLYLPGAFHHQPEAAARECRRLLLAALAAPPLSEHFSAPVQWFCDQSAWPLYGGLFTPLALVSECVDQPPHPELQARADCRFVARRGLQSGGDLVLDGVDVRQFARAHNRRTAVPHDIHFIPKPIFGYFGSIDERIDYGLIAALAEANPHASIVMVGPVSDVDPAALPRRENIFWLGPRPYGDMPAYAFGFDVCIAPFALSEAARLLRPVKIGEYLMAGRPVVSTDLPEVRHDFAGFLSLSSTREDFIAACRHAMEHPDSEVLRRAQRTLAKRPWRHVAAAMEQTVDAVLAAR